MIMGEETLFTHSYSQDLEQCLFSKCSEWFCSILFMGRDKGSCCFAGSTLVGSDHPSTSAAHVTGSSCMYFFQHSMLCVYIQKMNVFLLVERGLIVWYWGIDVPRMCQRYCLTFLHFILVTVIIRWGSGESCVHHGRLEDSFGELALSFQCRF